MKRLVFVLFIVIVAFAGFLPAEGSRAAVKQASARKKPVECAAVDRFFAAEKARDASRTTVEVAARLESDAPARMMSVKDAQTLAQTSENPIDREIFGALAKNGVQPAGPATDSEFCRRVYLDLTGKQPTSEQALEYLSSTDPQKKEKLIDKLIGSPDYVEKWANWMGDLLRVQRIDGGTEKDRNFAHFYLRDAVATNKPWNRIATDFITHTGRCDEGPGNFLRKPMYFALADVTGLAQDAFDEAAAETTRAFLGVQSVCISCHNGAGHLENINLHLSQRKRAEYWGISAHFAQMNFESDNNLTNGFIFVFKRNSNGKYIADTPDGKGMRPARFGGEIKPSFGLFSNPTPPTASEVGGDEQTSGTDPRELLAASITSNVQFPRAFVNRVFARFFTLGLVEPLDQFDLARLDPANPPPSPWELQPSNPALLTALAESFRAGNYDMRALIRLIVTSKAYAMSSRYDESKWKESYARLYARKLARRLQAEELLDAITGATQVPGVYYVTGVTDPVTSAMAVPGVYEPIYPDGRQVSVPDNPYEIQAFLTRFGRGNRDSVARSDATSLGQTLSLFNDYNIVLTRLYAYSINNTVRRSLAVQVSNDLRTKRITPEAAIEKIYLATLARRNTVYELKKLKKRSRNNDTFASDLQWALMNRSDFLYNY